MQVCASIAEVRAARAGLAEPVGFVPTMGALHAGHLALVRRARQENASVIASIFVNPLQFASASDTAHYPRTLDRDLELLESAGVDMLILPSAQELYPPSFSTTIDVGAVALPFEGATRPGHFQGVATVVTLLFNLAQPQRAYFGEKDAQQLRVVRRLVSDLLLPLEIVGVPTVRDHDGLALSSRNALLTPDERQRAAVIPRALTATCQTWQSGERDATALQRMLHDVLRSEPLLDIDYASLVDPDTLAEHQGRIRGPALVLLAVRLGAVRLIDNCLLADD
jgi:pantoate--beta-alanine ligase